jgi:LCP family protein required for cell wall assembly
MVRWTLTVLALALLLAACTGGATSQAPGTSAQVPTTAQPALTTQRPPQTTTTTTPPPPVSLALVDAPKGVPNVVQRFYLWLKDRSTKPPPLPEGLVRHLEERPRIDKPIRVRGTVSSAEVQGTRMAVLTAGDDVVLLLDEGEGWRIVGAKLPRFEKGPWYGPRRRMVLVIGSDARPGQDPVRLRADSLHVLTAVTSKQAGAIVGIPRDSWVTAPSGRMKFTEVMFFDGPEGVLDTARRLTGLPLEGYLVTGFAGFVDLVDQFGELSVLVPFDMADRFSKAFFEAGRQDLNGSEALAFARNRHIPGGDFGRSHHQGQLMKAALRDVHAGGIGRLPQLLQILTTFSVTDLPPEQLFTLGAAAYELRFERVPNVVVPGGLGTVGRASVVFLGGGAERIFADLEDGVLQSTS